jgi:hypothetical protein
LFDAYLRRLPALILLQVVVNPHMSALPDVMVAILGIMTALAAGPKGSRFILQQFRHNIQEEKLQAFTWARVFG